MALTFKLDRAQILTVVVLGAGCFVGMNFIYGPSQIRKRDLDKKLIEMQSKGNAVVRMVVLQRELAALEAAFQTSRDEDSLQKLVGEAAGQVDVKVLSMEPQERDTTSGFQKVSIAAEVRAGYHAVGDFLSALESSPEFLKIDSIHFLQGDGGGGTFQTGSGESEGSGAGDGPPKPDQMRWKIVVSSFCRS